MPRLATAWRRRRDDDGFTLTELMVSMAIMAVLMLLVTAGVLLASSTSARVDAAGTAQQQVHGAFDKLDRQVRWASAFSTDGTVGTASYVEWLYTAGATPTCYQLRLDSRTQVLAERSWPQGTVAKATGWLPLASKVTTAPGASKPFTTSNAGSGGFGLARLEIAVTSTSGGVKAVDSATHDVTFTAVNSAAGGVDPKTVCSEGRPTA